MRVTTSYVFKTQVGNIENQYSVIENLQEQVSSGKKIQQPSEDPLLADRVQSIDDYLNVTQGYTLTSSLVKGRANAADIKIQGVTDILMEVQKLITMAQNDTYNSEDRANIANNLSGLLQNLVNLANAADENNEYLFSGINVDTPSYAYNGSNYVYQGSQETSSVVIGQNKSLTYNDNGDSIFGNIATGTGSTNIFNVINEVITTLNTTTGPALHTQLDQSTAWLSKGFNNVVAYGTSLGVRLQTLEAQSQRNSNLMIDQTIYKGSLLDVDMGQAITALTTRLTNIEITQQSYLLIQETLKSLILLR